jgi:fructose-1,6-bisphosphatase/inositol monophosphatase family enzyme
MKNFIAVARDAALKAGRMLREDIHGLREITYKGDINLVTEMDMRSERTMPFDVSIARCGGCTGR